MKTTRKIGPLHVWIVGHTQNPLVAENPPVTKCLAVFYKKKDAVAFQKANATLYRVFKATITRDNYDDDLGILRRDLLSVRDDLASCEVARAEALKQLNELQRKVSEGKIWNVENARITPRAQAAIALAHKEAQAAGATYVGTEHVLLGLLKQGEGIAHRHFLASGMSYEKAEYAMRVGRHS